MVKASELLKNHYKPKDIAMFLGVTTRTLQNWDKNGKIMFRRDAASNRRYLTKEDTIQLLKEHNLYFDDISDKRRDVIYARVSSHDQKSHGDLDRQVQFLIDSTDDLQNILVLSEVGSGLNDKRKKLQQLLKMVMNNEVNRVFITYRDRLTRFGFHYLETMFNEQGVEIVIVKQKTEEISVDQELMNDMMSLIASFSGKLYGMRSKGKHGKRTKKESNNEKLEELIGKEQVEHYLELIGKDKQKVELVDGLTLEDVME